VTQSRRGGGVAPRARPGKTVPAVRSVRSQDLVLLGALALGPALAACKRADASGVSAAGSAAPGPAASEQSGNRVARTAPQAMLQGPIVGAIVGQVNVMSEPSASAKRLGYIRLGSVVRREAEPSGKSGCPGGWYKVQPRGYVCVGDEATIDPENVVLRATTIVRPDRESAMPYRYGFVRAVLPLYLKAPSEEEQLKSEFKLKEHLAKFERQADELNKVILGSYDVPVDGRGAPIVGKKAGDVPSPSTGWGQGVLFGGQGEDDPVPWWLDGGRKIPNLADFKVPPYAVFADRARRHTGLSFVGSFKMGPEALNRRFAITTDMRLVPTSKVKPDTGSPWHGIEMGDGAKAPPMPFAWIRTSDTKAYKFHDGKPREKGSLDKRSIVLLTGKRISGPDDFYWELKNGFFIKASQAGVVREPAEWPEAAKKGKKWLEVSIENQTLTLWEGQKAVYATLVSTGQDGMGDPKTSKSTVRGVFQIQSKHVTATMDSNEGSTAGGGKIARASTGKDDDDRPRKKHDKAGADKGGKGKAGKDDGDAKKKKVDEKYVAAESQTSKKREKDPGYGLTKRRGEGTFWLRDVPYVQYFEKSYALHVAYWHDVFGIARSHGCINLSPIDGKYIFAWTGPAVPEGWHGIVPGDDEPTYVIVHE
jgi:lipoprotein-anchoring transpeptidase ErfK/SrfK